jgi:hypothetical protein
VRWQQEKTVLEVDRESLTLMYPISFFLSLTSACSVTQISLTCLEYVEGTPIDELIFQRIVYIVCHKTFEDCHLIFLVETPPDTTRIV